MNRDDAKELLERAKTARHDERYGDAKSDLETAIKWLRKQDATRELAGAVRTLAEVERRLGEPKRAKKYYEEAVDLLRGLDDPPFLAHTLRHIADVLVDLGDLDLAEPYYQEAIKIYQDLQPRPALDYANALRAYGVHQQLAESWESARAMLSAARDRYAKGKLLVATAEMDGRLAEISFVLGDRERAGMELAAARASARDCGDTDTAAFVESVAKKIEG